MQINQLLNRHCEERSNLPPCKSINYPIVIARNEAISHHANQSITQPSLRGTKQSPTTQITYPCARSRNDPANAAPTIQINQLPNRHCEERSNLPPCKSITHTPLQGTNPPMLTHHANQSTIKPSLRGTKQSPHLQITYPYAPVRGTNPPTLNQTCKSITHTPVRETNPPMQSPTMQINQALSLH